MVHRVIEANDYGWVTSVCDSVCLEKPYTTYLGSRLAVDDLLFSRLAVDDLPGSRLVNAESIHAIHKTDHKQNYYRSFIYKDKLGFHLSRQDQTTFKKSRRLPGSSDDFARRLLGSSDDFQMTLQEVQTTSRRLTSKSSQKRLPGSPDESRRLPGSPDDFVRRLPRSPDDFQTTNSLNSPPRILIQHFFTAKTDKLICTVTRKEMVNCLLQAAARSIYGPPSIYHCHC
ncbi:hypothetical protein YC2023_004947 [Brassica napus]